MPSAALGTEAAARFVTRLRKPVGSAALPSSFAVRVRFAPPRDGGNIALTTSAVQPGLFRRPDEPGALGRATCHEPTVNLRLLRTSPGIATETRPTTGLSQEDICPSAIRLPTIEVRVKYSTNGVPHLAHPPGRTTGLAAVAVKFPEPGVVLICL